MSALTTALELAPVVERVHGANHPELTRVRELTEEISRAQDPGATADLFRELRTITDDYTVPADGCEAYLATYTSLREADEELAGSRR